MKYYIILAFCSFCPNLRAQTTFIYDASGNRLAKVSIGSAPPPTVTATPTSVSMNQASTLQVQGCTAGTITWSTGHQSTSFVVYPCQTQVYTVSCKVSGCPNQSTSGQTTITQTSPFTNTILTSQKTGDWNDPAVWCCGRIPTLADRVIIYPTHTVSITDNTAKAKSLGFESPASRLLYLPVGRLQIGGN